MEHIGQNKVPEGVVVRDHEDPEEDAHRTRATETVEILRGEAFGVFVLLKVDQLGDECGCFCEHRERDEHLLS